MRRYMALVPALCTFGPLEMVIGYETPYHLLSLVAALSTSVGILIIFANVMQFIPGSDPSDKEDQDVTAKNKRVAVTAAIIGLMIVAGGAFYFMAAAHR